MPGLLSFLLFAGFFYLMMRFGCGAHVMGHGHSQNGSGDAGKRDGIRNLKWLPPATDVDPVCGKSVQTAGAKSSVHDGTVYYFCSRDCREIFEAAPTQYVDQHANPQHPPMEHSHG